MDATVYNLMSDLKKRADENGVGKYYFHALLTSPGLKALRASQERDFNQLVNSGCVEAIKRNRDDVTYKIVDFENKISKNDKTL